MVHKGTATIETERLILRGRTESDAEAMWRNFMGTAEWRNNHQGSALAPIDTIEDVKEESTTVLKVQRNPHWYNWLIVPKDIDEPIGRLKVISEFPTSDEIYETELARVNVGPAFQNKGYETEALLAVTRFFFEEVGVAAVETRNVYHSYFNQAKLEEVGFKKETYKDESHESDLFGALDSVQYKIESTDYFKLQVDQRV